MRLPDDPKRTGVKAAMIPWVESPAVQGGVWVGPHGAFLDREGTGDSWWILCCPGCGEMGSPTEGQSWVIEAGSFRDVESLTLWPAIERDCCGWRGRLTAGVFEYFGEGNPDDSDLVDRDVLPAADFG